MSTIPLSEKGAVRARERAIKRAAGVTHEKHQGRPLLPSFLDFEGAVEALAEHDRRPLPAGVKIKSTANVNGRLSLQRWDPQSVAYLLVVGTHASRRFEVKGWLYGHEIARDEWRQREGWWLVPTGWPLREWTGHLPATDRGRIKDARATLGLDRGPAPEVQLRLLDERAGRAHDRQAGS